MGSKEAPKRRACPSGAQNKGLSPRIVAYSPFGTKSSYSLSSRHSAQAKAHKR